MAKGGKKKALWWLIDCVPWTTSNLVRAAALARATRTRAHAPEPEPPRATSSCFPSPDPRARLRRWTRHTSIMSDDDDTAIDFSKKKVRSTT